jgi:hypothetical protein
MEHYLVRAKVGRRTYFLAVDSHAVVTDHYLIDGTSLTMLPLPNWTGQGYLPREVGQHVRTVKVPRRKR